MPQLEETQEEWVAGPYNDDVDHDDDGAYGVEAMYRVIAALHGRATMPTALQLAVQVMSAASCESTVHARRKRRKRMARFEPPWRQEDRYLFMLYETASAVVRPNSRHN